MKRRARLERSCLECSAVIPGGEEYYQDNFALKGTLKKMGWKDKWSKEEVQE